MMFYGKLIGGLIGLLVNMLPLRTEVSPHLTFRELLRRVRGVTLDAYAHKDAPFDRIVEHVQPPRDPSRNPVFQIMLQLSEAATLELPGLTGDLYSVDSLFRIATQNRPALAAAEQRVRAADAGYRAARRAVYPDITVSLAYGQRPEYRDLGTLMVGVNLPLWAGSRQKPLRREMDAMRSAEEARAKNLSNETFARLAELRADAERASNLARLYETSVLPQARAAVESSLSAYRVGDVEFSTLVANQLTVNRYEVQRVELIAEFQTSVGAIEALTGGVSGGER